MQIVAKHKASGCEMTFDNVVDMREYLDPVKDLWVWFFRYQNGFETPKHEFS